MSFEQLISTASLGDGSKPKYQSIAEDLAQAAADLARRLAGLPTVAIGHMKKNLNTADHGTLSEVLDSEAIHMIRTMMTEDHKAASQAFVDKRAPVFQGR